MTKKFEVLLLFLSLFPFGLFAQSSAFGIKGGLTMGTQKWDNSFQQDPLFRYHAIAFIESANEEEPFSIYAQGGYHVKGSAIRTYRTTIQRPDGSFDEIPAHTTAFEFKNISLGLGSKQKFPLGSGFNQVYYMLGVRAEYTVDTDFDTNDFYSDGNFPIYYPVEDFVNNFTFGATIGGGIEIPFSELTGMVFELTVNPDFTRQYSQPQINNIINPNPNGPNTVTIPERQITNLTFEATIGFRFLRKVVYID